MVLHPEVQRKAQEELDRVIGRNRLPDLGDRDSLPYMQCVVHETMRFVCCWCRAYAHGRIPLIAFIQMAANYANWLTASSHGR